MTGGSGHLALVAVAGSIASLACGSSGGAASGDASDRHDAATHEAAASSRESSRASSEATSSSRGQGAGGDAATGCPTRHPSPGPVLGVASGSVCAYLGIPFAAPPVGARRWRAPEAAATWTSPRASAFGPDCAPGGSTRASSGEDCLYLNVWTPEGGLTEAGAPDGLRPTMVFVHGGGFVAGSGADPTYDGAALAAATGHVVVTINYRLGVLGFLSNAALRSEDAHGSAGNYGILDQIAAFRWVKDNVGAFGGDGSRVTIFGQSAGGISMTVHLASPVSAGSFDRMIIESADAPNVTGAVTRAAADAVGGTFAAAAGCSGSGLLACLRGKSLSSVLGASDQVPATSAFTWFPVIDGYVVPDYPLARIAKGEVAKVPLLLGTNGDDGQSFVGQVHDAASYLAFVNVRFPGHGAQIVAQYPASMYGGSDNAAAAAAFTDGAFACPARDVARAVTAAGVPVYRYDFTHGISLSGGAPEALHGAELAFVFGNTFNGMNVVPASDVPLRQAVQGYWGAMAATGDPNGGGRVAWPGYASPPDLDLVLDLPVTTEKDLKATACAFWDGLKGG